MLRPVTITDSVLTSHSIAESEHSAWSAATNYSAGNRVIYAHSIYENVTPGVDATTPNLATTRWLRIGPTNRWAAFDKVVGTQSTAASTMSFTLTPGQVVDGLALLNLTATSVTVSMTVGASTVYSKTVNVIDGTVVADWYGYYSLPILPKSDVIFDDLPAYATGVITVTLTHSGQVALGTCVVGLQFDLGRTQYGASVGIIDYTKKETDQYGVTSAVERGYAKKITVRLEIDAPYVDEIARTLAQYRATPVVWIGAGNIYTSLIAYGFYRDWSVEIAYATLSYCSLQIEGLS